MTHNETSFEFLIIFQISSHCW